MTRSMVIDLGRLLAALLVGWGAIAHAADPTSRDELFGTSPPASPPAGEGKDAAPASKDSLFGTAPPHQPPSRHAARCARAAGVPLFTDSSMACGLQL